MTKPSLNQGKNRRDHGDSPSSNLKGSSRIMLSRRQALLLIALVTACVLPPCTGVARRAGEVRDDGQAASLHDESLDRDGGSSIHPLLEAIGESAGEEAGDTSGGRDAEVETGTKNRQVRVAAIANTSGTEINWHPGQQRLQLRRLHVGAARKWADGLERRPPRLRHLRR